MAISGSDLLATNGGELVLTMFPGDNDTSLTLKLDAWVAKGMDKYDADEDLAEAYAYVQAYTAAINLRASVPMSATLKTQENRQYTDGQLQALERSRARWEAELPLPPVAPEVLALGSTFPVCHRIVW